MGYLKPRSRSPSRCSKCRGRKTFPMDPSLYEKPQWCPCGGIYKLDKFRKSKEHKDGCRCDGYEWSIDNAPHRMGSPDCYFETDGAMREQKEETPN